MPVPPDRPSEGAADARPPDASPGAPGAAHPGDPAGDGPAGTPALVSLGWNTEVADAFARAPEGTVPARVVRVERIRARAAGATGEVAVLATPLPAVGDWVALDPAGATAVADAGTETAWPVVFVAPRRNAVVRRAAGTDTAERVTDQVVAANLDVVVVCVPLDRPLRPGRVERELVLAWDSGARPVVALTKADLAGEDPEEVATTVRALAPGVEVLVTSASTGAGVDAVAAALRPHATGVLLGASGAGKSSLANRLLGAEVFATGAVRSGDRRGRHTTTARTLVVLPGGGSLIDTPGLRSLGLYEADLGLAQAFADIEDVAEGCRFRDCAHDGEPGCAVVAAVADGLLDPDRLARWQRLALEQASVERRRDDRAARETRRAERAAARAWRRAPKRPSRPGHG